MNTAKDDVTELLRSLPDDCSLEEIQYHLYVLEKVRHGMRSAESDVLELEQVKRRLDAWLSG